ncbi:MAG: energy-coupling factor transporter transmembrane protein EcfT [Oscillospiraceae bacterium]|nr:energy-coupling factor transporter transmembrane protein EcfT [Oscillospiraceae bacterium]
MLKDITIGQYFPGQSIIHRLDPRFKIIMTILLIIMLFAADSFLSMALCVIFVAAAYILTKLPAKLMWKSLKPVVPILVFTAVINIFFYDGDVIFRLGFLKITDDGLKNAMFMLLRIILLIIGTSVLTYTTSPIALTDAIERLMSPLKKLKVPVHELAMMMTIALRFIPTLIEETDKIIAAQKARGADFESGNLIARVKAMIPILIPLFISAFKRAEELALAMECRCYNGGEGRTRLRQLKIRPGDFSALFICCLSLAAVIVLNII